MKFNFSLEKVLNYKEKIKNQKQQELADAIAKLKKAEERLLDLENENDEYALKMEEDKQKPYRVEQIRMYENYFLVLRTKIEEVKVVVKACGAEVEQCRNELLQAKVEEATIDKLKEKRLDEHTKMLQKKEERQLEEFFASSSSIQNKNM